MVSAALTSHHIGIGDYGSPLSRGRQWSFRNDRGNHDPYRLVQHALSRLRRRDLLAKRPYGVETATLCLVLLTNDVSCCNPFSSVRTSSGRLPSSLSLRVLSHSL